MRLLIVGASGFTGSYLMQELKGYSPLGTSRSKEGFEKLDLSDKMQTKEIIKKTKPNNIIIPAYFTNLDYIETHKEETRDTNVLGIKNVILACTGKEKIIFYSTDAVFKGDNGPYSEEGKTSPINEYGRQKLEAENLLFGYKNHLVIRTCSIYGIDPRRMNFVARLIDALKEGKTFNAPIDQFYTPTYVVDLARITRLLIEKNRTGVFHISGDEFLSRYEIGKKVCEAFGLPLDKLLGVKTDKLKQDAPRPTRGGLVNKKVVSEIGYKFHTLYDGLKEMTHLF
jgi:dTDP-4-dehydrorhamnose reductase